MSRLLTTLLLYRSGFMVGKYVSLEAKIAANKDMYYAALRESSDAWYDESSCPISFIRYWLQMLLAAYHLTLRTAVLYWQIWFCNGSSESSYR